MIESWKEELDGKYEKVTSTGDVKLIDKANEIILNAIVQLEGLNTIGIDYKKIKEHLNHWEAKHD